MKFYTEEQINRILEDSNTIAHFKEGLAKLEDSECGIIETVKVEEGDSIIIQYPESFADKYGVTGLKQMLTVLEQEFPDIPVVALVNDIDVLIQQADDAIEMLEGMKAKIQIVRDTPAEKKIIIQ